MDRLVGPHAARHESDRDLAVGHGLDVAVLAVHDSRPQDDVECVGDINDVLVDVDDGDVATTARRGPEDGELGLRDGLGRAVGLGGGAHRAASVAGAGAPCSGLTPPGASGGPSASPPVASQAASSFTLSISTMSPAGQLRGPSARTSSVTRAIPPARRTPSAALAHTRWSRAGSMPRASIVRCNRWNRRRAL